MASDINRVTVTGRLTRDAELRQTQGGSAILAFGIAVNDRRKNNQTGEWEDYANFVDCVLFGNRAQSVAQYLVKGTKVAVEGKLRWSQWEREGQKRSKLEVVVDELVLMGGGQRQQMAPQAPQMPQNAPQAQQRYSAPPQQQMAPQMPPQMPQNGYQPMPQQQMPQAPQPEMFDMDIPF